MRDGGMDLLELLDEIRILASNGLHYAQNDYDRERYERLMALVEENYGQALDMPSPEVRERLRAELGHVTPKVGSDGAIFDESGRILLMLRTDERNWCLPCGWIEPGETPAQAVVREVREETGLECEPVELVDVFARPAGPEHGPHGRLSILYLCSVTGGTLTPSPEGTELRYWRIEDVPDWFAHHERLATAAREAFRANAE
ncbi:MAG: NUDIX domain-containing protein [Candidatus Eisenbacteria bacterium]|nr:NUDIX domain-containing protein [Candidatus Eisenbacteria bacterium]